jgi:hypothetical protein
MGVFFTIVVCVRDFLAPVHVLNGLPNAFERRFTEITSDATSSTEGLRTNVVKALKAIVECDGGKALDTYIAPLLMVTFHPLVTPLAARSYSSAHGQLNAGAWVS